MLDAKGKTEQQSQVGSEPQAIASRSGNIMRRGPRGEPCPALTLDLNPEPYCFSVPFLHALPAPCPNNSQLWDVNAALPLIFSHQPCLLTFRAITKEKPGTPCRHLLEEDTKKSTWEAAKSKGTAPKEDMASTITTAPTSAATAPRACYIRSNSKRGGRNSRKVGGAHCSQGAHMWYPRWLQQEGARLA